MPSIREFKARLSFYIAESRAGKSVDITSHRRPVARLVGVPQQQTEGLAQMIAEGELTWSGGKPKGGHFVLPDAHKSVAEMILEDRG